MSSKDGLVRVNIHLTKAVHRDMSNLIPWGMRRNVLETVLMLILDAIREDGVVVAGAILDGQFKLIRTDRIPSHYGTETADQ